MQHPAQEANPSATLVYFRIDLHIHVHWALSAQGDLCHDAGQLRIGIQQIHVFCCFTKLHRADRNSTGGATCIHISCITHYMTVRIESMLLQTLFAVALTTLMQNAENTSCSIQLLSPSYCWPFSAVWAWPAGAVTTWTPLPPWQYGAVSAKKWRWE